MHPMLEETSVVNPCVGLCYVYIAEVLNGCLRGLLSCRLPVQRTSTMYQLQKSQTGACGTILWCTNSGKLLWSTHCTSPKRVPAGESCDVPIKENFHGVPITEVPNGCVGETPVMYPFRKTSMVYALQKSQTGCLRGKFCGVAVAEVSQGA